MTRSLLITALLAACAPSEEDLNSTRGHQVEVFFNDPGTRAQNMWEPDVVTVMVEAIRGAQDSIDLAVMGFNRDELISELIAAYDRGVEVRFVGDAGHLYNDGYKRFMARGIPMAVGNYNHIMHDKFMVIDDRFTFGGTANWTDTDLRHNSNNFFMIDSPLVADRFTAEFEKMSGGLFGHSKSPSDGPNTFEIGDTTIEVYFSPNDDSLGRMLELVDAAQESLRFTIFAFTKDTVGGAFVRKQEEWAALNEADGLADADFRDKRSVAGVIDKSQLHSNQQYHEAFRLLGGKIPMRLDGNENSKQPGDYQAGGGRLHSKTMAIDVYGEQPVIISGSFNWSASATQSNDEFLMVFHGARVAQEYDDYFESLWDDAKPLGNDFVGEGERPLQKGDLLINEIMWFGQNDGDDEGNDQYIELLNTTNRRISLDMWQIAGPNDFVVGIPPGYSVGPGETFLIVDHVLEAYQDGIPQDELSSITGADYVVNAYNDNRQARLYLKDGYMDLKLLDPNGRVMDRAGDGGPPFAGGPSGYNSSTRTYDEVFSMERREDAGDGTSPDDWYTCTRQKGGDNVNEGFKEQVIGTPGQGNSREP